MSGKKNRITLIVSSLLLAFLLYLLFAELYLSKNLIVIVSISVALVIDTIFFVRSFLRITYEYKDSD